MNDNEIMQQIKNNQMSQKGQMEYVVRGAQIRCSNGDKQAVVNLPKDHGQYLQGSPQINVQDSKKENIQEFGNCKLTNKKCNPVLSSWLNGNENKRIWDQNTLKAEATVINSDSYCVCMKNQGIISVVNSGQIIRNKPKDSVYITEDRTAIVVNNIRFEIYNPYNDEAPSTPTFRPLEEWYTIMEYTMTEKEFKLSKALLGINFEMEDFGREEVSAYVKESKTYSNGKVKESDKKIEFVSKNMNSNTKGATTELVVAGLWIVNSILKKLADAVEYTYVTFFFQKSSTNKHRVVLMGGTLSDTNFFQEYGYYLMPKSYLYNVVADNMLINTRKSLKDTGKKCIEKYLEKIENNESRAKLLVEKKDLWLKKNECYDAVVYLKPKRQYKQYQVYLYSEFGTMCQRAIMYGGDSIAIVKRNGSTRYSNYTKLIEISNCLYTSGGNKNFWKILDRVLKEQANEITINLKNPSQATTVSLCNLKDEIPKNAKPQSIEDLNSTY